MPLEFLGKNEQLNVKRVEIPEVLPEKKKPFKLEDEITPTYWKTFVESVEEEEDIKHYGTWATWMLQLCPERRSELDLKKRKREFLQAFKEAVAKEKQEKNWIPNKELIDMAYQGAILYPEIKDRFTISSEQWQNTARTALISAQKNWPQQLAKQVKLLVINPDGRLELKLDTFDTYEKLVAQIKEMEFPLFLAMNLRLLYPDRFTKEEIDKINSERLANDKYTLDHANFSDYMLYVFAKQVLTAKTARITGQGVEFIPAEPEEEFKSEAPSLPELKQ